MRRRGIIEAVRLGNLQFAATALLLAFGALGSRSEAAPAPQKVEAAAAPSTELTEFQQVEDKWSDAIAQKDQYALELMLAPSFVGIGANGAVTDREQEIARLFTKGVSSQAIEFKAVSARALDDAEVVNGTYILHIKKDGTADEKGIFTHVFQRSKTGWLCINAQYTAVVNPANGKPKDQKKN